MTLEQSHPFRFADVASGPGLPVVVCVDVEPDPRVFDRDTRPPWQGFEQFVQRLGPLRERLSAATRAPVALTWTLRMDPQVEQTWGSPDWVAKAYAGPLGELVDAGDELGLHTHTYRWDAGLGEWITEHEDAAWGERCVTTGLDAFETAFGHRPTAHRGGAHFISGAMLACLDDRGVTVDLTVEAGLPPRGGAPGVRANGCSPDYRAVPTRPYRSSPRMFPAPDPVNPAGPLLIPLTSAVAIRRRRAPLPAWASPLRFATRLAVELLPPAPPVLAFALRSDAALGPWWDAIATNLGHLARRRQVSFVTASTAAALLGVDAHVNAES